MKTTFQKLFFILLMSGLTLTSVSCEPEAENPDDGNEPGNFTGYTFTTTNFDDGWSSTVKEDWVEVSKGNIKVLLHYPKEGTVFPAQPEELTNAAWNILVAPRYSNLTNYKTAYIEDYEKPYFAMGTMKENASGNNVFVTLFRRGAGWIEVVAPDNNSFTQEFGFNPESIRWGQISEYLGGYVVDNSQGVTVKADVEVFNKIANMAGYNKFAVALADLNNNGQWQDFYSSTTFYYDYYTGSLLGGYTHTASQWFTFKPNQNYHWEMIVTMNTGAITVDGDGAFKSLNNWQLYFSDIDGAPKTYDAYFTAIKGGRILWLNDAEHPGSGIFTGFGKK